jgi:hypothetical protein
MALLATFASMRWPGLHFHDLRHVGGTLAAATGASLKELMARLGYSTRAVLAAHLAEVFR